MMNALLKFLILGFFLIAYQPLFSEEHMKEWNSRKAKHKYKKHLKNSVWIVPPSTFLAYDVN